jgi:dynein heavy chain
MLLNVTRVQGCNNPINDYLKMTNKKKVIIRDINPKSISTQVGR